MWESIKKNWKTNLASLIAFLVTVPSVVTAFQEWSKHQPVDWRAAATGLVIAAGLAVAKDSTNHSTADEVQAATQKGQLDAKEAAKP